MTSTKKFYISIAFLLIITAVMAGLAIIPSVASIRAIGEKIREQDQKLAQKKLSGFSIEKVRIDLAAAALQEKQLDKVFVGQGQELALITQIEGLAQKLDLNVQVAPDLNLKPINNKVQRLPIKITASGSYLSILKFISDLEASDHYFNVSRLDLKPKGNEAGDIILELEGEDYLYFEK